MASRGKSFDVRDHTVIGSFSTDEEMNYCDDLRNRRFFNEPDDDTPNFDLLNGLDEFVDRETTTSSRSLSPIMEWMRDHRDVLIENDILVAGKGGGKLNVDFVARRGILSRLLRAASSVDQVDILVTLCNGTYYIVGIKEASFGPYSKEMTFAGKRFLHYVTSADEDDPNTAQPLNANASYYSVSRASCGEHSILFTSETQAERKNPQQGPPNNYVAIKTNKPLADDRSKTTFKRHKTLTWWSQTHMAGIPDILCGFRDDSRHVISSIKRMKTKELPGKSGGFWTAEECQKKFHSLLSDIKDKIRDDDPTAVYQLGLEQVEKNRGAKDRLRTRMFTNRGLKGDDDVIVKDWYLHQVLKMKE